MPSVPGREGKLLGGVIGPAPKGRYAAKRIPPLFLFAALFDTAWEWE